MDNNGLDAIKNRGSRYRAWGKVDMGIDGTREFPEGYVKAVQSLAGAVASTYGPVPRDKLIIGPDEDQNLPGGVEIPNYRVTSDAATILEELELDHPVAPIIARLVGPERPGETDVEGKDVPDGITGTVVFTAALLDEAMELIERGLHPRTIQQGYRASLETALGTLESLTLPVDDHLLDTAQTAMTGNAVGGQKERLAEFAVEAVERVGKPDPDKFAIANVERGRIAESTLIKGTVLDRNEITDRRMPDRLRDATVLVLDGQDEGGLRTLELNDRYSATVSDPSELAALRDTDAGRRERILDRLHDLDVDVVVAKQGIEKEYAAALAREGIIGIDGVTRLYLSRVARATGAEPVKRTEEFDADSLGTVGEIREIKGDPLGDDRRRRRIVVFDDCSDPGAVTVLLRGIWGQLADIATKELRKAVTAVAQAAGAGGWSPGVVPGGGATEIRVSMAVSDGARTVGSREQLAREAFAEAASMPVFVLAKNSGYDPHAARPDLRSANENGEHPMGFSFPERTITDVTAAGIVDPFETKRRSYVVATEVATLLLRIDDALPATFSESVPDPDEVNYEGAAGQQQSYLEKHDDTRWD